MFFYFKNVKINYLVLGDKGKWLVFLHGWGGSVESFLGVAKTFKNNRCLLIDFPPFGFSEEPQDVWDLKTYADMVFSLIQKLKIKKISLISHSFGGRVAIHYCSNHPIEKLVLFASPCVRLQKELPLSVKILKKLKTLPGLDAFGEKMKKYIGSRDYKAASPIMRQTLVFVVNEDLSEYAKQIEEPTLLIWGDHDDEAPLEEAKILENLMYDAALIVLPGTHYAYIENLSQVVAILNNFI